MAENSKIEWTDHTFNPWEGCAHVSPGCIHCYAETRDRQYHGGQHWGLMAARKPMSESYWKQPAKWNRQAEREGVRRRVFCASLADVFEFSHHNAEASDVQAAGRQRLGEAIRSTPWLDWLLLTKRPENWEPAFYLMGLSTTSATPNVWVGVTAEDQKRADERIPILLQIPAAVRFVSYEPALELVDFTSIEWPNRGGHRVDVLRGGYWCKEGYRGLGPSAGLGALRGGFTNHGDMQTLDWIIIGGESGPGARQFDMEWARKTIGDCKRAGVAAFFKQAGAKPITTWDSVTGRACVPFNDKKGGGDMDEWPEEFHVREFPRA